MHAYPEISYAVLQGLPSKYFAFLDLPRPPFCQRIENALKAGEDPLAALQYALDAMNDWGRSMLKKLLSLVNAVMELPGLTYRQKEVLIVLRSMGAASLPQLNRALKQDRSNLRRRLYALVDKGYAVKFLRPEGTYYYAPPSRTDKSLRSSVRELLKTLIAETASPAPENLPPSTSITTTTMITEITMITKSSMTTPCTHLQHGWPRHPKFGDKQSCWLAYDLEGYL